MSAFTHALQSPIHRRAFLARTAGVLGLVAGRLHAADPVATSGSVPTKVLHRLATGANICRWFRYPVRDTAEHFDNYIPESEAAWMAQIGLRHVRLCIHPRILMDPTSGALIEERARQIEQAIRRFHAAGLLVVVDPHNESRTDELDPAWQTAFVTFWSNLARRLSDFDPALTVLEFINEPVFAGRESEWPRLQARLIEAVRAQAPQHTLMTSGANWGGINGLRKLEPVPDRNVVYSFHCYDPFPFTHQGATWSSDDVKPLRHVPYPSSPEAVAPLLTDLAEHPASRRTLERYGNERWDRSRLAARFEEALEWGRRHQVPLYCGEFGVFPRRALPEHRAQWFRDFGGILSQAGVGWAVWGWDEGFGFNRRHVEGRPMIDPVVAEALGMRLG